MREQILTNMLEAAAALITNRLATFTPRTCCGDEWERVVALAAACGNLEDALAIDREAYNAVQA